MFRDAHLMQHDRLPASHVVKLSAEIREYSKLLIRVLADLSARLAKFCPLKCCSQSLAFRDGNAIDLSEKFVEVTLSGAPERLRCLGPFVEDQSVLARFEFSVAPSLCASDFPCKLMKLFVAGLLFFQHVSPPPHTTTPIFSFINFI